MGTPQRWTLLAALAAIAAVGLAGCAGGSSRSDGSAARVGPPIEPKAGVEALAPGAIFVLGDREVTVRRIDVLPLVDNAVSRAYVWDTYGNPKLERLRLENRLDEVIAPGRDEFEKQLMLMDWVHAQIEYGDPLELTGLKDSQKILDLSKQEQRLYCAHYASLLISTAASLGWVCRPIGVHGHGYTEIWSNQYRKWIVFDPNSNWYPEIDGRPINTYELRRDWFENRCKNVDFRRSRFKRPTGGRSSFEKYHTAYFVPNTRQMDESPRPGSAFVMKDQWSASGTRPGTVMADPAVDPYFPINQAALSIVPQGQALKVSIRTLTPNFKTFRLRIDTGLWTDCGSTVTWPLHEGHNVFQVRSVNQFNVPGPVSTVELAMAPKGLTPGDVGCPLVMPAMCFTAQGGGTVTLKPREGLYDPAYVHLWFTPGHWLEWTVDAAATGEYDLLATYATRYRPTRELKVNGTVAAGLEAFDLAPTEGWGKWSEARLPARVALAAGRNVLRMTCLDRESVCLSEIRLSRAGQKDLVINAARPSAQGGGQAQVIESDRGGFFYGWDDQGHSLEWTIADALPGRYDVYLRHALLTPSTRRLLINNEVAQGLESFPLAATGGWRSWVETKLPAQVTLAAGTSFLRLENPEGKSLNLGGIRLVRDDGREIQLRAVEFSRQEGGTVRSIGPSNYDAVLGWKSRGHWLQWTVEAPADGLYAMQVRYATQAEAPREVRINGRTVKGLDDLTLPRTSTAADWQTFTLPGTVRLAKGTNTVRITATADGELNLDEIVFVRQGKR